MILSFLLANVWRTIAVVLILALVATWVALGVQTKRLEREKQAYQDFRVNVEVAGREADRKARDREMQDKLAKEKANAENARTIAALRADISRLRAQRPSGGILPGAGPATGRADRITFDRAELERALREYDAEVQGLVDEGSEAIANLNTAKRWAQQFAAPPQ